MSKLPVALVATRLLASCHEGEASSTWRRASNGPKVSRISCGSCPPTRPACSCRLGIASPTIARPPRPTFWASNWPRAAGSTRRTPRRSAGAILVTTLEAAVQRLPPADGCPEVLILEPVTTSPGDVLQARLEAFGYRPHGRVDDHGEVAIRGEVIDIFPSGSTPYRLTIERRADIAPSTPTTPRRSGPRPLSSDW